MLKAKGEKASRTLWGDWGGGGGREQRDPTSNVFDPSAHFKIMGITRT